MNTDLKNLLYAAGEVRDAFEPDPGTSDLDDEQPIHITIPLGTWRSLNWALSSLPKEPSLPKEHAPEVQEVEWLESQLIEVMRLSSRGLFGDDRDDAITDTLRLHGVRLLLEGQEDRYEALLARVKARASSQPQNSEG